MTRHKTDALVYFGTPGPLTDLTAHMALVETLPTDVGALCGILHGLVMHPGPVNWGVEMSPEVAQDRRSIILDQVSGGVSIRQALIRLALQEVP